MNWIVFGLALWAVLQIPIGVIVGHCLQRSSRVNRGSIGEYEPVEVLRPTRFLAAHRLPLRRARRRDLAQSFSLRFWPMASSPMRRDPSLSRAHR